MSGQADVTRTGTGISSGATPSVVARSEGRESLFSPRSPKGKFIEPGSLDELRTLIDLVRVRARIKDDDFDLSELSSVLDRIERSLQMDGTTVDPRVVAGALQMDTHDLAKLICGFASDTLPTEIWLERSYKPLGLDDFDERVASARLQLVAAHRAWSAWTADNTEYADVDEAEEDS